MESPRTTFALGPLEISLRRRQGNVRLGVLGSLVVHGILIALFMLAAPRRTAVVESELVPQTKSAIPITFVGPPPTQPKAQREEIVARTPPAPASTKPLRMQPVPESVSAPKGPPTNAAAKSAGQPVSGSPPRTSNEIEPEAADPAASKADEPKDILGRLREFREAVEAPQPPKPQQPKPLTMPNLPSVGLGIGNLQFEGNDYDWESYGRQIHGIIWRAWHNYLLISSSVFEKWAHEHQRWILDHRGAVRFTILRSGKIIDVMIVTPSECYPLDESIVEALNSAVLPPLPDDFRRDSELVQYMFIADDFDIRLMRVGLQRMKNAGYF